MNYDQIIIECLGDCDNCKTFLECQYQTSPEKERKAWLEKLIARDEALKAAEEAAAAQAVEESACEEATPTEEPIVEETFTEEPAVEEPIAEEIADEVANEAPVEESPIEEAEEITEEAQADEAATIEDEAPAEESADQLIQEEAVEEAPVEEAAAEEAASEEAVEEIACEESPAIDTPVDEEAENVEETEEIVPAEVIEEEAAKSPANEEITEEAPVEEAEEITEEAQSEELAPIEEETAPIEDDAAAEETVDEPAQEEAVEELTPIDDEAAPVEEEHEHIEEPAPIEEPIADEAAPVEEISQESAYEGEDEESDEAEGADEAQEETEEKEVVEEVVEKGFKLVPPENNDELLANMCAKRGRKLIYRPNEAIITVSCKVLGTDKKNDIGEKVKDILDAEIKQGTKLGYLDKFDGLKSSEIKEEYEDDIVYEYADQEFKKTGVIYDGKDVKVYLYDWDVKACHHVGKIGEEEANEIIPYLLDKDKYSFDVCGIITGGKGKRVIKEGDNLKIVKEKGEPIGLDVDITVIPRKD